MTPKFHYIASATLLLIVVSVVALATPDSNDIDRSDWPIFHKERARTLLTNDVISPYSGLNIESIDEEKVGNEKEIKPKPTTLVQKQPALASKQSISDEDRLRSIAMNSREIRLVGPDGKEVEMKDDVPTKLVVAFENLQKEASEVWDQMNTKLDKGWNEFKTMVERAVKPEKKSSTDGQVVSTSGRSLREIPKQEQKQKQESIVFVRDVDGYSMADEDMTQAAQSQAESTGAKIKTFFSDIGINDDNTKKAGDALSKAGTAVSETMTKDLPDALKKAGSAVSDTVTKDIPDAFKNFFG